MHALRRSTRWIPASVALGALAAALLMGSPEQLVAEALAQAASTKPAKAQAAKKDEPGPINDNVDDPAVWGKAFPLHYELYKKTVDMQRTKYGGSEGVPRTPTQSDPRAIVSRSKVDEDIGLKTMWQGYAFAADFREERGHAYMLEDQKLTLRQQVVQQPGACLNCHASTYLAYKKAGDGDTTKGFEKINAMPYGEAEKLVQHPVACIDCHDGEHCRCGSAGPRSLRASALTRRRKAFRTTTSTSRRRRTKCAPSYAASVTSSTTSRVPRNG